MKEYNLLNTLKLGVYAHTYVYKCMEKGLNM